MSDGGAEKKPMPKGGRKGGTRFPQINLADAERYCNKLVSKTHNGPQPDNVILPGVFDSAKVRGKIRASGMKQYGLMQGEAAAYEATSLAKKLAAAPPDEKQQYFEAAFLTWGSSSRSTTLSSGIRFRSRNCDSNPHNSTFILTTRI